jgi:hypothetical protein
VRLNLKWWSFLTRNLTNRYSFIRLLKISGSWSICGTNPTLSFNYNN